MSAGNPPPTLDHLQLGMLRSLGRAGGLESARILHIPGLYGALRLTGRLAPLWTSPITQTSIYRNYASTATQDVTGGIGEAQGQEIGIDNIEENDTFGVILRPYQETAISACLSALSSGLTRIGVSSPTGSGKTTMFMSLIPRITQSGDRHRTLILVGSVELASQAEAAAKRLLGDGWKVEVEQGKRSSSGYADITIGTYQTLNNAERLKKFDPSKYKLVIVDEAHHAAAISYLRLLHHFNDQVRLPSDVAPLSQTNAHGNQVPIIGFSATFSRPDQLALSAVFEKIVFHREVTHMLQEGWLSPAKSVTVKCDLHLDQVELGATGDFKVSSLSPHVNTPAVNDLIVRTYLHRGDDRRSTLVFCVDLSHVANLTQAFRDAGVDARSISSISAGKIRKETLEAFARGDFPVLVNCEVLTEGADVPVIDCVILARPTKSKNLLAQMVGRGLRLSPGTGKEDCLIVDIVDSIGRANGMLVSPTLFGLTHEELAEKQAKFKDEDASLTSGHGDAPPDTGARVKKVTFVDQDDPFGVASPSRLPIVKLSSNAWVACGGDRYILELLGNGYISIDASSENDDTGRWSVRYRRKLAVEVGNTKWFSRVQPVAEADDLERAIQTADKFAERTIGRDLYSKISRNADWRQRLASGRAVAALLRMKGIKPGQEVRELEIMGRMVIVDRLKAGEVASYLCAATHGAMAIRKRADQISLRLSKREQVKADKARASKARNLPLPDSL